VVRVMLHLTLEPQGGNNAGFVIPADVVDALGGGKRPKVVVTVNGYTYRTSIGSMGGRFLLGVNKAHRDASGLAAGDEVDLEVVLDEAPRTVEVPEDLAAALAGTPAYAEAWAGWSFTRQKEAARQLGEAKRPETRARRLDKIVAELAS
jgi:hypothetical protein